MSKMRMKIKIEVNWNNVYISSDEGFGLRAFVMKKEVRWYKQLLLLHLPVGWGQEQETPWV